MNKEKLRKALNQVLVQSVNGTARSENFNRQMVSLKQALKNDPFALNCMGVGK